MSENEKEIVSKEKDKEKEIRENQKKSLKAAAPKKRSPFRYFKEVKAEFKKVTWPPPKQVVNNTGVVLTAIVLTGAVIFGLDWLLAEILSFVYQVNLGA